ncbi:MAG: proline--tRNA ligase [Rhodobacteraceae bacterium]|nr:proline--tRNA ligase [Paracoccaceae bacterium]
MRLSRYFLPVLKENPSEAQIVSHRLMLRAGMIKQQAAGIYSWLPMGYRVLKRIEQIVHEEQVRAGHIPMLMPTLQPADLWRESGRYDDYGAEMLRIKDRHERDMLFGPTNEEMITDVFRSHVNSYKDLPHTHEFLVLASTGESEVFYDDRVTALKLGDREIDYDNWDEVAKVCEEFTTLYARTDETHDEGVFNGVPEANRKVGRGIEVGQIFYFGTKYSESMGATVVTKDGGKVPVEMGSHGIGVSRLLGAIIEASHDDKGIIWPEGVTPFKAGIVNLKQGDAAADAACEGLYKALAAKGLECLYDDREERAGAKFATMDLIGLPWRITVGPRGLANGVVELTSRRTGESEEMSPEAAVARIEEIYAAHP